MTSWLDTVCIYIANWLLFCMSQLSSNATLKYSWLESEYNCDSIAVLICNIQCSTVWQDSRWSDTIPLSLLFSGDKILSMSKRHRKKNENKSPFIVWLFGRCNVPSQLIRCNSCSLWMLHDFFFKKTASTFLSDFKVTNLCLRISAPFENCRSMLAWRKLKCRWRFEALKWLKTPDTKARVAHHCIQQ